MTRKALPNRRPCVISDTYWQGNQITVAVGHYADGTPGEVFADASYAVNPLLRGTLSDACVALSIALQHGITPDELGKSLSTEPSWQIGPNGMEVVHAPASPIGPVVEEIRKAIIGDVLL